MQDKMLDAMHRGYSAYLQAKGNEPENTKMQRAILRTDKKGEKCDTVLSTCEINTDWVEQIESSLPFIDRAIKENRQFILRQGETVPIEKARRVSKTSVEHLARHSQMITREPAPGEEIIPEKILMTENIGTYAVYENRFLYMLLCYIKDFSEIKYAKICENANLFSSEIELDKTIGDKTKKISFSLKYKEVSSNAVDKETANKTENGLKRIKNIIAETDTLLKTGLMVEVSAAPVLKPPIARTNVLLQNTCFSKALELYDYLVAYNGNGYTVKELYKQSGALKAEARADYAELIAVTSYLSYRSGGLYDELEERYKQYCEDKLNEERKAREKRIYELKQIIGNTDSAVTEYVMALEDKCADAQAQIQRLNEGKNLLLEAEKKIAEAEQIRAAAKKETDAAKAELRRQQEILRINKDKHKQALSYAEASLERKDEEIKKINENHKDEIKKLNEKFIADYKELAEKYNLQCARVRGAKLAEGGAEKPETTLSKEEFLNLEAEYNAFKKYFESCWKETKKQIRRKELWKK